MEIQDAGLKRDYGAIGDITPEVILRQRNIEACDDLLALLREHHDNHPSIRKYLTKAKLPEPVIEPAPEAVATEPTVTALVIPLPVPLLEPTDALVLPSIAIIARETAKFYQVTLMDMFSARRTADVCRPRQVGMYLAKIMTLKSLPEIGRRFGGRDHTTILHAVRKIERLVAVEVRLADEIEVLKLRILQVVLNQNPLIVQ